MAGSHLGSEAARFFWLIVTLCDQYELRCMVGAWALQPCNLAISQVDEGGAIAIGDSAFGRLKGLCRKKEDPLGGWLARGGGFPGLWGGEPWPGCAGAVWRFLSFSPVKRER